MPGKPARAIRSGDWRGHTSGLAPAHVQGNLMILPQALASDFQRFCQLNPKPCPVLGVSEPGVRTLPALGEDLDLATDVPGYRIYENGEMVSEVGDLTKFWQDDLVTFVLGCSFSFEDALIEAGIPLRTWRRAQRGDVPDLDPDPARRPVPRPPRRLDAADEGRRRDQGGAGDSPDACRPRRPDPSRDPSLIGIRDIGKPDFGDAVAIEPDEILSSGPAGSRPKPWRWPPACRSASPTHRASC